MDAKVILEEFLDFLAPKLDVYEQAMYLYILLSVSLRVEQVLQELSDLEEDDLRACLMYASQALGGKA